MAETQEHDDEFTDPVLERTDSTPLWWLRRAFAVVFYESDEGVGKGDWIVAYGLGAILATVAPGIMLGYQAITQGPQSAATEVSTAMTGEGIGPEVFVAAAMLLLSVGGLFLAIAATWKLFHGDSE